MRFLAFSPFSRAGKAFGQRLQSIVRRDIRPVEFNTRAFVRKKSSQAACEAIVSFPVTWHANNLTDHTKVDGRVRLSQLWVPTGGIAASSAEGCRSDIMNVR